jgi:hypothetical protein
MTISILPFFQRPSRPLLAVAEAGATVSSAAANPMKKRFISPL